MQLAVGWAALLTAAAAGAAGAAADDLHRWDDGSDLESFVSRPDIRAPRMMVSKHRPDRIREGYWFMTPYSHFDGQARTKRREFVPCQTGAHIYDGDGDLIWSGACWGGNRNIHGLRPLTIDGHFYMSMYLPGRVLGDDVTPAERNRSALILDHHFQEVSRTNLHQERLLEFHEFNVQPGGKTALVTTEKQSEKEAPELNQPKRLVIDVGFQEIDIASGSPTFIWNPIEHGVLLNESCNTRAWNYTKHAWDYLHINAVDKSPDGDYFVSARHTSTIYKVSRQGGHIIWRLGGYTSDFVMEDGLAFFWQHDVRFLFQNETTTIISVFDNTGDDEKRNPRIIPNRSSGKIIALDTSRKPMTARVIRRIDRPDGNWSPKLGNVQLLGNDFEKDNIFVNWGIQGYVSEHAANGDCVFEARFQSPRMSSYRAYKQKFVSAPGEPPALKVLPINLKDSEWASAFYVSWNGATEVAAWDFYARVKDSDNFEKVGWTKRTGFESSWVTLALVRDAYVEALDVDGKVIGRSTVQSIESAADGLFHAFSPLSRAPTAGIAKAPTFIRAKVYTVGAMWSVIVDAFALLGVYYGARKLLSREFRRPYTL